MVTMKFEIDPGDGTKPLVTTLEVDPARLPELKKVVKLVAILLRENGPQALLASLVAKGVAKGVERGLAGLLAGKRKT